MAAGSYKAKLTLGTGKNAVSAMVDYTIAKATPVVTEVPVASAITYGQTLAESSLLGGKVTYSDADGTVLSGTFAWKDGIRKRRLRNSQINRLGNSKTDRLKNIEIPSLL